MEKYKEFDYKFSSVIIIFLIFIGIYAGFKEDTYMGLMIYSLLGAVIVILYDIRNIILSYITKGGVKW